MSIDIISGNEVLEKEYYETYSKVNNIDKFRTVKLCSSLSLQPPFDVDNGPALVVSYSLGIDEKSLNNNFQSALHRRPDIILFEYKKSNSFTHPCQWNVSSLTGHDTVISLPFRNLEKISEFLLKGVQQEKISGSDLGSPLVNSLNSVKVFDGLYSRTFLVTDETRELLNNNAMINEIVSSFAEKIR